MCNGQMSFTEVLSSFSLKVELPYSDSISFTQACVYKVGISMCFEFFTVPASDSSLHGLALLSLQRYW